MRGYRSVDGRKRGCPLAADDDRARDVGRAPGNDGGASKRGGEGGAVIAPRSTIFTNKSVYIKVMQLYRLQHQHETVAFSLPFATGCCLGVFSSMYQSKVASKLSQYVSFCISTVQVLQKVNTCFRMENIGGIKTRWYRWRFLRRTATFDSDCCRLELLNFSNYRRKKASGETVTTEAGSEWLKQ